MGSIEQDVVIPTIDLSAILSPSPSRDVRNAIVSAVRSACQDYGFFQLTGHCIPLALQRETLLCAKRLFDLPLEEKKAMSMSKSMGMSKRGYEAVGGQKLDTQPDTKEGFYLGVEIPADDPRAGSFLKGPNFWPPSLSDEEFRTPLMNYHARVLELHEILINILAEGLEYDGAQMVMQEFMKDPVANIKLLHYPPNVKTEDDTNENIGAGAHTDFGCTTILLQQPEKHGLQVLYPPTNTWISVPAKEDAFIVNVGDLLDKWTKGKYRSAVHRVVNVNSTDRYSIAFFYQGNLSTELRPLDGSDIGKMFTETVEEHIRSKFKKTFG